MLENYSAEIQKALKKEKAEAGQRIVLKKGDKQYEGFLMPKSAGSPNTLVIKLDSGYNIGVEFGKNMRIKLLKKAESSRKIKGNIYEFDSKKPTIAILHTGGTIAASVDYRTGAVFPAFTPEELFSNVPELADMANFRTSVLFQMFSEDMEPEHWKIIVKKIVEEIERGADGIIITHGTDTMTYTSSAISLMARNISVPVILVGAQRSADRGSSDASMNLLCAAAFAVKADFSGVAICMHGSVNDDYCLINPAFHTKKMHTSRRDAFRSIDRMPYAKVYPSGAIEFFRTDFPKRDKKRKANVKLEFERKIGIIKMRPGFDCKELELYEKNDYRGIIIEGTGLGNAPVTNLDEYTKNHTELLRIIERMTKKGIIIGMVSQCPYGKVNMNVYSTGRDLLKAGVLPFNMTTETAYTKLGWALGNIKDKAEIKKTMVTNLQGEIVEKVDPNTFLM